MKTLLTALLLLWTGFAVSATPQEMLEAVDEIRAPGENFGFSLRLVHEKSGKTDSEFTFDVRVKDAVKSLVTYTAPPTAAGKKLLLVDQNMWIYVPGTRRPIRISPQQQLLGQVSNADVARVVYNIDYRADSVEPDRIGDRPALRLKLVARNKRSPYRNIDLFIDEGDYRPLVAKFYALSGRLLKTVEYLDYRMVLGRQRPMRLEVQDEIKRSEQTRMVYTDLRRMSTPESHFQKDFLPRL